MDEGFLGLLAMSLAILENARTRFHVVSKTSSVSAPLERVSDVWPDWSTELSEAELAQVVEKNRPSVVLRETAFAVIFSVGLVIALMVVLNVSDVR